MQTKWTEVDEYINQKLVGDDKQLTQALENNQQAGLPAHDVSPNQGKLLHLMALMINARRILEIGTLGGYSTIWLARALPEGGQVVTLEADADHARVALENIQQAGLADKVQLLVGPALDNLPSLLTGQPFDLIFIDADKPNNPAYLQWALKLAHPGTVIIGDNVVREGEVTNPASSDDRVQGVRSFFDLLADEPGLTSTALQTVGGKGWDGFTLSLVREINGA